MTLAIIATVVFMAHVAVWIGIPNRQVTEAAPSEMVLESA